MAIKLEENKMSKKSMHTFVAYFCSKDPKVHLYQFLSHLDHFPRTRYNYRRKKIAKILLSQRKNGGFLAKNRPKIVENFQNFGNQYKPLKYTSSPNFGSFGPLLAKKWLFLTIFGPYFALFIYKGM